MHILEKRKDLINSLYLRKLEKNQINPKGNRRKGILKISAESNEKIEKINKTKGWYFEMINEMDKSQPG